MNAAAAREIGREMETMSFTTPRDRRNSLPRSVHSTVTDDFNTNSPPQGDVPAPMTMAESAMLPPPVAPFARQTISPRPSFERLQPTSSQPPTNHIYRSPLQPRQNRPISHETIDLSLPTPSFPTDPPSPQITTRSFSSSRASPDISSPIMSKVSSTASLPPGGRTITAAAFKRAIPRKGSEATMSDRGRLATASPTPSQSHLQSPVIPRARERSNSDSRPLPTPPQHDRDGDYSGGRFVTNLEDEWK